MTNMEDVKELSKEINRVNRTIAMRKLKRKVKKIPGKAKKESKVIIKNAPPAIKMGTWKVYEYLREHHRVFLAVFNAILGNIGWVILSIILLYLAWLWYPYYGVFYYILGLIEGSTRENFIHMYLIPYGIIFIIIAIVSVVLYYSIWDYIFPRLNLIKKDKEQLQIGRVYFYSPETKRIYANLDILLNIFKPKNSLKIINVKDERAIKKGIGEMNIHAEGVKHLHDEYYEFTGEFVPQQEIYEDIVEKYADIAQSQLEHATSRALRYNAEINKSKYKSTIILFPSVMFKKEYHSPRNPGGIIEVLQDRIQTYRDIRSEANTDNEVQEDLSQKIAPVLKEIYQCSKSLEEHMPEFAEKNKEFEKRIKEFNGEGWLGADRENLNYLATTDLADEYVNEIDAILRTYIEQGGIEE